ncbi:hypothetical protein [Nocardioides sp. L-11A]|uniref:hypothetical protein n=1 Tax=Nocardioides sp. L-11A TaxID=3043848 RepID=UPI00249C1E15|nr:hypothetical protein QJ852_15280 [Nocardioides sp. L-11A]
MLAGPLFEYDRIRDLVPTRQGMGPVWVAWDTNVLSLYERYVAAMCEGDELTVLGTDPNEVEALSTLIFVWLWWDLRFIIVDATATDTKNPRPAALVEQRDRAMEGLRRALSLGLDGDGEDPEPRIPYLPPRVIASLPKGHDRVMVPDAFAVGADVFLTIDKGILKRAAVLRDQGLVVLPPTGLVDALVEAGLDVESGPRQMGNGLAPDLGHMSALLETLGV